MCSPSDITILPRNLEPLVSQPHVWNPRYERIPSFTYAQRCMMNNYKLILVPGAPSWKVSSKLSADAEQGFCHWSLSTGHAKRLDVTRLQDQCDPLSAD